MCLREEAVNACQSFDKEEEKYYIAEVFGVANNGWERYIVEKGEYLVLVDYLDITTEIPYKTNIETVDFNALEYITQGSCMMHQYFYAMVCCTFMIHT